MSVPDDENPCLTCGACCAYFRILLNWTEVDEFHPDGVPETMTARVTDYLRVMLGTDEPPTRCIALEGEVGVSVRCKIYEKRCSMCREFSPLFWDDGTPNEACDRARAAFNLCPLKRPATPPSPSWPVNQGSDD